MVADFWKTKVEPPPLSPAEQPPPTPKLTPLIMSRIPDQPRLTPQFCFNQTALRGKTSSPRPPALSSRSYLSSPDFLRISRGAVDDTISQNLNALVTPGTKPFDPSITTERQPRPVGRRPLDASSCDAFKEKVLFPSWQSRSDVLSYCAGVATSPDPNDPDHVLREVEDARKRERVVNERLDPYSFRNLPRDTRTEALASLIRNERMVEGIIRTRTWGVVGERCENDSKDFESALDEWRTRHAHG